MTEKQKMMEGLAYQANDKELVKERLYAKKELKKFNDSEVQHVKQRKLILKQLFGESDANFYVEPPFRCDYGYNIFIGDNFYANYNLTILDCAKVSIGRNVMFGPNISLFTAGHPIHFEPRNAGWEYAYPISIGDNVWIGGCTVVNPGVNIGENVVIGSGSVVTKDIPSNSVAVGNPCKVIRSISEEEKSYYFKDKVIE